MRDEVHHNFHKCPLCAVGYGGRGRKRAGEVSVVGCSVV